jgi:predicted DNA-binding protein
MRQIEGKRVPPFILPASLWKKMERQRKKEGRTRADFLRRVLDRYFREVEFRGDDLSPEARESIQKNKQLLHLLRNA